LRESDKTIIIVLIVLFIFAISQVRSLNFVMNQSEFLPFCYYHLDICLRMCLFFVFML